MVIPINCSLASSYIRGPYDGLSQAFSKISAARQPYIAILFIYQEGRLLTQNQAKEVSSYFAAFLSKKQGGPGLHDRSRQPVANGWAYARH